MYDINFSNNEKLYNLWEIYVYVCKTCNGMKANMYEISILLMLNKKYFLS